MSSVSLAVILTGLVGCESSSDLAQTARVQGTVSYQGKPVTTGTVMFIPVGGGPPATGQIQPDGSYVMKTYFSADGAVLGEHKVTITALDMGTGLPEDEATEPKALIPEKYSRDATSGLTATVGDDENEIDFPLE
ncbi:hypothetical protein [Rubinisphaera margarita]|uniref:hypothetical protein n=1 Tax=Rubinisphaera margarita TaxID=2909586 RepID=UPI001EE892D2|nr:hypothetical protein [Rubinisphaera margarita]MCG6155034.1 hypothetical protein [Rubinisphaera margarita]